MVSEKLEKRRAELAGLLAPVEAPAVAIVGAFTPRQMRKEEQQRAFDLLEGAMDLWVQGDKHD
jgi:hypothetical protein